MRKPVPVPRRRRRRETRAQKIDRQRGAAADRMLDSIRAAIDQGDLVIRPVAQAKGES